jgi:hypothetical protein
VGGLKGLQFAQERVELEVGDLRLGVQIVETVVPLDLRA